MDQLRQQNSLWHYHVTSYRSVVSPGLIRKASSFTRPFVLLGLDQQQADPFRQFKYKRRKLSGYRQPQTGSRDVISVLYNAIHSTYLNRLCTLQISLQTDDIISDIMAS